MTVRTSGPVADARVALLELGGREVTPLAAAIERLAAVPAFSVMAAACLAARPQWAGVLDDLFDRPLLRNARSGLRNAFASTLAGDTLYRNAFFSFTDAVVLWHYGHTQERRGGARVDSIYRTMLGLLAGGEHFRGMPPQPEPDVAYFHRLRRVVLTRQNAYPLLRRAARLLGAVEAEVTQQKIHPVRGSLLTSYVSFAAQVIAMAGALREGRDFINQADIRGGFGAFVSLVETPPSALTVSSSAG